MTTITPRWLLPFAWLVALYIVTVLTATLRPNLDPTVLEFRNIALHATVFAIQFVLVRRAVLKNGQWLRVQDIRVLLVVALALGIGQEVLQAMLRGRVYPLNSLLDLTVDVLGASLGLWIAGRRAGVS